MPTRGLTLAAVKLGATVKASTCRSRACGALQGCVHGSCPHTFITRHRVRCGSSAADSTCMERRPRCMHYLRHVSAGLQGRHARQREAAASPATLASCSTAASVPECIQTRLLHSTASETLEEEVPATAAGQDVATGWRARAAQSRSTSQYTGSNSQPQAETTVESSSKRRPLSSCDHRDGLLGSRAGGSTPDLLLKEVPGSVASPPESNERKPTALADISGQLPPAFAGSSRLTRAAAAAGSHWIERGAQMDSNGNTLPFRPATNDCETPSATEATPQAQLRVHKRGSTSCGVFVAPSNLSLRKATTSSCVLRATGGLAGSNFYLGAASFQTPEKDLLVAGVTSAVGGHRSTWNSCQCAFISSLAAVPACAVPDVSSANAASESAAGDAASWHLAPGFLPAAGATPQPTAGASAAARARETCASKFLAGACAGPRGSTAARKTTERVTGAATTARGKPFSTSLVARLLQLRFASSYSSLPLCRTVSRKTTHLCDSQPQSAMPFLGECLRRHLTASLVWTRDDRRHTKLFMTYEQHSTSTEKMFSDTRISSISSRAYIPVFKRGTRYCPPAFRISDRESGTTYAVAAAAIRCVPYPFVGAAGASASAAASAAAGSAATDVVSRASGACGLTSFDDGLAGVHTAVTRLPLGIISAGTTRLELDSALSRRHYIAAARGLQLCGNIFSGASADTPVSARAASTCGAIATAAAAGQQQLPTEKRLLSFDACTIRIPHPSKRDKGGEDASACTSRLLVVADGVGGWGMSGVDAGLYSRELVQRLRDVFEECCEEKHVQQQQQQQKETGESDSATQGHGDAAISENSLGENNRGSVFFERTPDPVQLLKAAYLTTRAIGSSTCCLVVLDRLQRRVRCANIGDSGFILYRPSEDTIVARSNFQSHDFNFPLQLGTGSSDMPEHAHVLELPVREGDIFLLATDGVWDNLYDEQVLEVFRRDLDVHAAAEELSRLAFKCSQDPSWNSPFATKEKEVLGLPGRHAGGKPDDITVVVAILKGDVNERTEADS